MVKPGGEVEGGGGLVESEGLAVWARYRLRLSSQEWQRKRGHQSSCHYQAGRWSLHPIRGLLLHISFFYIGLLMLR